MKIKTLLLFFTLLYVHATTPMPHLNLRVQTKDLIFKSIEATPEDIDLFLCKTAKIKTIILISLRECFKKIGPEKIEKILNLLRGKLREIHFYDFCLEKDSLKKLARAGIIVKMFNRELFYKNPEFESKSDTYNLDKKNGTKKNINKRLGLETEISPDSPGDFGGSTPNPWATSKIEQKVFERKSDVHNLDKQERFYKNPKFESNSDVYGFDEKNSTKKDINEYPELEIETSPDSPDNFGGSTPKNPWL